MVVLGEDIGKPWVATVFALIRGVLSSSWLDLVDMAGSSADMGAWTGFRLFFSGSVFWIDEFDEVVGGF